MLLILHRRAAAGWCPAERRQLVGTPAVLLGRDGAYAALAA
jgi:hypothetical protein